MSELLVAIAVAGTVACDGGQAQGGQGAQATGAADPKPATATSAPASSGGSPSTAPRVRLGARRTPEHGTFLTDANGRALYVLEEDPRGVSACYEMCAAIWPPLLAGQGTPVAGDSAVRANLIGTIERRGGGAQVTYAGQPLYYYLGDARPGETRGQDVEDSWGEWYLVSPSGRHVEGGRDDRGGDRRGRDRRGGDR